MAACGAAPLPTEILLWYRNLGLQLSEGYGMTRNDGYTSAAPGRVRPGYVGMALQGVESQAERPGRIADPQSHEHDRLLPRAGDDADAFTEDGFFRTGDLVVIDRDGQLKIIGRLKEQFKTSKGKYVAPAPIEGKLMEHPAVEACCLMGAGQPSPFAIVVLADDVRDRCVDPEARKNWKSRCKPAWNRSTWNSTRSSASL